MDRLSSCYFCGDALDASLDEYPVVPASIAPGPRDRRSIVLCQSCKRKLDPVVEAVVDAVDAADGPVEFTHEFDDDDAVSTGSGTLGSELDSEPDPSGTGSADSTGDDTEPGDDASTGAGDIGSTLGDDDDLLRPVGGEDSDGDRDDGEAGEAETGGMEFGRSAGESGAGEEVETDTDDRNESSDDDRSTGERKYTSGQRAGGRPMDPGDGGSDDGDEDENESEADGEGDPDVTMTRLENTNVMRLLRNREFPVERDDFVTVASSAYEISPRKCEKVIQLAIKHDLIREDEGQLLAGDNWR